MSNVKPGDFCTHVTMGGLMHVERELTRTERGFVFWDLTVIGPIICKGELIVGKQSGLILERKTRPETTAYPGSSIACSDYWLRRVDPPKDEEADTLEAPLTSAAGTSILLHALFAPDVKL